jgi:UDP-2,3-diacylglucosamine pyrophosphatase LpxH
MTAQTLTQAPWCDTFRADSAPAGDHNILVVSDLHLGEGLADTSVATLRQVAKVAQAFSRFLAYYAAHRPDERPWRLVIAGDMIDFVRARIVAEAERSDALEGHARAVRALERIMAAHADPFADLARFLAAGHDVVILKGNHDVELHYEEIQQRLVDQLVSFVPPEQAEAVRARVSFARWFWYEGDLVYVEHGNQYDRFCSFEHVLEPTLAESRELEEPISHRTLRGFAQLILGTMDVHGIDRWRLVDFARWLSGLGPRVIARLAYTYVASVAWMVATRRRLAEAATRTRAAHLTRLAEVARHFRLGEDVLHALDALRERPAGWRVLDGARMLYMDRVAVGLLTILGLIPLLAVSMPGAWRAGALVAWVVAAVLVLWRLARDRDVATPPKLRRVAARIGALMRVRYVVFGHSHVPAAEPMAGGGTYFNTGSWSGDAHGGLTHLCIVRGLDPRAELRRWCAATHAPVPIREQG